MDLSVYFEPLDMPGLNPDDENRGKKQGDHVRAYNEEGRFPSLGDVEIAIIGAGEERGAFENEGCSLAPDYIRKYLYQLYRNEYHPCIADLGNIKKGHSLSDTYFAIKSIVSELAGNHIVPIILGGSHDLTYANYLAYATLGQIVNIVSVDPMFDLGQSEEDLHSRSFLSKIILHQPNFLFNYTNIGYQSYFVDPESVELMRNLYFDVYRLGVVRQTLAEVEPMVRNADILSFDVSSVRQSDAPGNANTSPNGFYGEEVCQIMRYAGLSDKLSSIGFYELNPRYDNHNQTAHLVAQMIWYFFEGFSGRQHEYPIKDKKNYIKFTVSIKNHKDRLVFFKSKKSDRWWMDVPVRTQLRNIYERHHLIPCSYSDYETACRDDIPDRWWQTFQKLM
ncbi:MAG: formimidoylglutamase [Bacteroidales bacterium]|nr:formimidoylglutamase [Bacteroidales bacterium]